VTARQPNHADERVSILLDRTGPPFDRAVPVAGGKVDRMNHWPGTIPRPYLLRIIACGRKAHPDPAATARTAVDISGQHVVIPGRVGWRPKVGSEASLLVAGTYTMWCDARVSIEGWRR
jgi:hypothetical protein